MPPSDALLNSFSGSPMPASLPQRPTSDPLGAVGSYLPLKFCPFALQPELPVSPLLMFSIFQARVMFPSIGGHMFSSPRDPVHLLSLGVRQEAGTQPAVSGVDLRVQQSSLQTPSQMLCTPNLFLGGIGFKCPSLVLYSLPVVFAWSESLWV